MRSRSLVILLVALAVLVALALAVSVSQRPATGSGQLLLPGLKDELNNIDKVTVRTGGNKIMATLVRGKDGWTVAERNHYPVDIGKLRGDLIALADARVLEEKTSNPDFYDRLHVQDVEKEGAAGTRFDLAAGDKVTSVIIGMTGVNGGDAAYARRAGDATSWLVSGRFDVPSSLDGWLDRRLTDINVYRVHAVTITQPDGTSLVVDKVHPGDVDFEVHGVPPGRKLSYPGAGGGIGSALTALDFDNAESAAAFNPGDVKPVVARFETFDGLVIEASTYKLADGLRVRFKASADKSLAERLANAQQEPPTLDEHGKPKPTVTPPPDLLKGFEAVEAEAAALNERLGGWVYTIPAYKSEQLTRRMDDLLAPKGDGKAKAKDTGKDKGKGKK